MTVTLSSTDLDALGLTLRLLASPLDHGGVDGWRRAVNDDLRRLLGADSAAFLLPMPGVAPIYSAEHAPDEIGRYPETTPPAAAGGVPVWDRAVGVGVGRLAEVYGEALPAYHASAYHNEYAAPNKAHDALGVFVPLVAPGSGPGMASVQLWHDGPQGRRFGDREVALMRLIYPAFRTGVETTARWARRCDDLADALDGLRCPAALLDVRAGALHTTAAFEALLSSEPDADADAVRRAVRLALAQLGRHVAAGRAAPLPRAVRTRRDSYRLHGCLYGTDPDRPLAVVRVVPSVPAVPSAAALRERFGLTPRQAEVAQLVARRLTTAEIAEALCVSPHTALRHTEAVFVALGVGDRRSAARVLRGGGPDAGALGPA